MTQSPTDKPNAAHPLTVRVEDDVLVIRIGVGLLAFAVQSGDGWYEGNAVVDVRAFAVDIARTLETDEEDGTTPVHHMLDAAADVVSEGGFESVVDLPVERGIRAAQIAMKGGAS